MKIRTLMLGAYLILASATTMAGVYKWTDEAGKTHYGDRKPENRASEEVNVRVSKSSSPPVMAPEQQNESAARKDSAEVSQQNENAGLTNGQRQANCDIAQSNLKTIQNSGRIRIEDDNGERRYLTPEEIEEKRAQMQQVAADNCSANASSGLIAQ